MRTTKETVVQLDTGDDLVVEHAGVRIKLKAQDSDTSPLVIDTNLHGMMVQSEEADELYENLGDGGRLIVLGPSKEGTAKGTRPELGRRSEHMQALGDFESIQLGKEAPSNRIQTLPIEVINDPDASDGLTIHIDKEYTAEISPREPNEPEQWFDGPSIFVKR